MNKRFLNIAMATLLLCGTTTGLVSCKDYDDDITEINNNADGLSKQLDALQTALGQANDAAKAAAADAKAALEKGQQAEAAAALAKEAAENAKAEAIKAVIDQLTPLINGKVSNEDFAKLSGTVAGISQSLDQLKNSIDNIDLTDINTQLGALRESVKQFETINNQIKALNAFKTALENAKITDRLAAAESAINELNGLKETVKSNTDKIQSINGQLSTISSSIETINGQLTTLSAQISSEVSNAVNTIAGTMTNRLSSVTLIPDLYIGGIPTIEFESARYNKQKFANNKWVDGTPVIQVTNNETTAEYRLNPGTIKNEDIDINNIKYVHRVAEARSTDKENEIVNVHKATVLDNGILEVKLGKSITGSLNLDGNKINTVSLKVPVAAKHLFTKQGEQSAMVYSEFTRLNETYFKPELAFVDKKYETKDVYNTAINSHLYADSTTLATLDPKADALVALKLPYYQTSNLFDYVEACKFFDPNKHVAMNLAAMRAYGFTIKFHVADFKYQPTEDQADQQQYVALSDHNNHVVTPKGVGANTDFNKVAIGKMPIIRAVLVDTVNNAIVEQKYLKIQFTAKDLTPVEITWDDCVSAGNACEGASFDFTWDEMSKRVLEQLNEKEGMSKEDFNKIYSVTAPSIDKANPTNGTLDVNFVEDNDDASIPFMKWTLTADQLGTLKIGDNQTVVEKTVTFVDSKRLHPNIIIKLKWTVNTKVNALTLGATDPLKWDNNTMKVYPVPMVIPYDGTSKAEYMTNILEGRLKPYVNGLLSCALYDVNYSTTNPAYPGEPLILPANVVSGHWQFTADNQKNVNEIGYTIAHDTKGIALLQSVADSKNPTYINIDWSAYINGLEKNKVNIGTVKLQIVKILSLNTTANVSITDNSRQQTIKNLAKYLTLTDAFGNLVAEEPTATEPYAADYYSYYDVKAPAFDKTKIVIADNAEGDKNVRTLASLNMTADIDQATNDLTFQNNGAPLQANAFIIVPVTVEHYWGVLKGHLAIPLNKSNAPLNAPAK